MSMPVARTSSLLLLALTLAACTDEGEATDDSDSGTTDSGDTGDSGDTATTDEAPAVALTAPEGAAFGQAFDITVALTDEDVDTVTLEVTADDTTLFPTGSLVVSGTGASRTITATSATGEIGMATITVTATDAADQDGVASTDIDIYVHRTATGVLFSGGAGEDYFHSAGVDDAGNAYGCGYHNPGASGVAAAIKYDLSGTSTWDVTIPGAIGNIGRECTVNADGQLAFATQIKPVTNSNSQATGLYTYDSAGTANHAIVYVAGALSESYGQGAAIAADGSTYQISQTASSGMFLYKFNTAGTEVWNKRVAMGNSSTRITDVAISPSGKIWVLGYAGGTITASDGTAHTAASIDSYIAVYTDAGLLEDFEIISTTGDDFIGGLAFDGTDVYISGGTDGVLGAANISGGRDFFVQKRTDVSTVAWTYQSGYTGGSNYAADLAIGHDGTVYATGYANYVSASDAKMHITAINPGTGAEIYSVLHGQDARFTSAGGIAYSGRDLIVTGGTNSELDGTTPSLGSTDAFLMFVDPVDGSIR